VDEKFGRSLMQSGVLERPRQFEMNRFDVREQLCAAIRPIFPGRVDPGRTSIPVTRSCLC
jgi:hypothetical protein